MATPTENDATVTVSRRERLRTETRGELVNAARALMSEHGVSGLRVVDITARTEVALGSFYLHFASKDEIVEAVLADTIGAIADSVLRASRSLEDPAEAMSVGIRKIVGLGYTDPELARLLVNLGNAQDRFESMVWPQALAVITSGVESGRFTTDDPAMALTIAVGAVMSVLRGVLAGRTEPDADVACATALLRSVGLSRAEASAVARRPLPAMLPAHPGPTVAE